MTRQTSALLYLYSNRNIVGCLLAVLGPILLVSGVIGTGWLLITAGLYAAGALLAPSPPTLARQIAATLSASEIMERLDDLIGQASSHVEAPVLQRLRSIRESVKEVLPRLLSAENHDNNLFIVRETVLTYLPQTISNYVALPAAFRSTHPVRDGKTSRQLMLEQIEILDDQMRDVVVNVAQSNAQALLANGMFLESKFKQAEFAALS